MAAGGMAENDRTRGIAVEFGCVLASEIDGPADVVEGAGPAAPFFPDAPVFEVSRRISGQAERDARVARVREIDAGAPESAVNHDGERTRAGCGGPAEINELAGVRAIGEAGLGVRWGIVH